MKIVYDVPVKHYVKYLLLCGLAFSAHNLVWAQDETQDEVQVDVTDNRSANGAGQTLAQESLTIETQGAGRREFNVEIADTLETQQRGLMFREALAANTGMLFTLDELRVMGIWMKDTLIPLDIIFIDREGKIVKIDHSHKPGTLRSVSSEVFVLGVLELAGGTAREMGIATGDIIRHPHFNSDK